MYGQVEDTLPIEFSGLKDRVKFVQRVGAYEYSSSCPYCGGEPHRDGTYPDRFRMFLRATGHRPIAGWCRSCGKTWWPGKDTGTEWKPTPEQMAKWIAEREEYEKRRKEDAERAMAYLQEQRMWVKYHEYLDDDIRCAYRERGIPDYWIDYWRLGYNPEFKFSFKKELFKTPTLTIPVVEPITKKVLNIKHRLISYPHGAGKYRNEYQGLPQRVFVANYDKPIDGHVVVVEGEFKAMVTFITIDSPNIQVVGIPGMSPKEETLLGTLKDASNVYLILDPEAYVEDGNGHSPLTRAADAIGRGKVRVVDLPGKVDDLINDGLINKDDLRNYLKEARVV